MRFPDFLRTTVLISAAAATALAAVTLAGANGNSDTLVLPLAAAWWVLAALIGMWLGRRAITNPPIATLLANARMQTSLPELNPGRTVLNRLWPLLLSTLGAGALAFTLPQVPAVAAGFAIIWSLAWRRQASAVTAIEERDGARFYVERTSPLQPIKLARTPGFRSNLFELNGASGRHSRPAPGMSADVDVLVVSIDSTIGWRSAANELVGAFRRAGASVQRASTGPVPTVRTFMLTDYVQARAAREAAENAIPAHRPRAVVYCSIVASLLWPGPGVVWLDSLAADNRPGRHGVWQRVAERRRLSEAQLVLTMSERSLAPLRGPRPASLVVPTPVDPSGPPAADRDVLVVTYAGNPQKKRLEFVLDTWARARRPGETLVIAGIDALPSTPEGVEIAGRLPPDEFRALLRRTRVFLAAPRREDFGIAPLEALADGCQLVTTPAPGPYPALDLARTLDPRLVGEDLVGPLRHAIDDPLPGHAERALELLAPFRRAAVDRTLADDVLPRLLA